MKKALVLLLIVALLPLSFVYGVKALSALTVNANPNTVNQVATYTLTFNTTYGVDTSHHITIAFPSVFYVPASIPASTIYINGQPITSIVIPSGTSIVITPPVNVGTYCYITIYSSAGVKNSPTGGPYLISVTTDTPLENPNTIFQTLSIQSAIQYVTVSVNPNTAGSAADYWINFTPGVALTASVDYIYVNFPAGSTIPSTIQCNLVTVDGQQCTCGTVTKEADTRIRIRVPVNLGAGVGHVIYIPASVGILNPPTAGTNYYIQVWTSWEQSPVSSNLYSIIGSNISSLYVSVSPDSAGTAANYTIQFVTGPSGALTATTDWIKIEFPSGTVVPNNTSAGYISINGRSCTSRSVSGTTLTAYIPSTLNIPNSSWVYVSISDSFGIVNPTTVGSSYTLKVSTSKDIIPATSNTYSITGTSVSNFIVSADPTTQNSTAAYTFNFRTSSSGALSRTSSDKIYIQFPTEFTVPSSISGSYVTVNGTPCTTNISVSSDKLTITTPVDISNSTNVVVVIAQAANIKNPSSSGTYSFSLSTTKDVVPASANLQIVKSTITKPVVQLTGYAINEVVGVTVTFQTGSGGALTMNSDKISIVFPAGFVLPSTISNQYVKVNNYNATSVTKSGQRIDITPSINILANATVTFVIDKAANIKNPSTQGTTYKLTVYTSQETTPIDSDPFSIVMLPTTTFFVTPQNPDGQNGYYITTPKVTLTATSPVDTNPTIYYFFDAGNPQVYSGVLSVPDGVHTLYFYAQDKFQNKEITQSKQFKVDTAPPAITVTYPQQNAILNTKNFTITGTTEAGATLTINNNSVSVGANGSFSYDAVISGLATFTIVAKDSAGNTKQFVLNVSLDTTPPILNVSEPKAFEEIHAQFVTVKGKTEKDAKVTINGTEVQVNPADYSFSYSLQLTTSGLNSIQVIAVDLAGNQSVLGIPVNFIPKTKIVLQVGNSVALVNDKTVKLDASPKIVKDRTLVPLRFIAEAFGADVQWNSVFKLVIIKLQDKEIILQIGTSYASVGDKKYILDTAPIIDKGYTMVPIRFIAEALNSSVEWDSTTKTVTIVYPK
jgi:hypothetical protein